MYLAQATCRPNLPRGEPAPTYVYRLPLSLFVSVSKITSLQAVAAMKNDVVYERLLSREDSSSLDSEEADTWRVNTDGEILHCVVHTPSIPDQRDSPVQEREPKKRHRGRSHRSFWPLRVQSRSLPVSTSRHLPTSGACTERCFKTRTSLAPWSTPIRT